MESDGDNRRRLTRTFRKSSAPRSGKLHELLERRAELMKRIGTIKQTLAGLANIFGEGVLSDQLLSFLDRKSASRQPGFTRACRVVLMEAKRPLGARLVCHALQQRFPEVLERHKDPIASVTTVLNCLAVLR